MPERFQLTEAHVKLLRAANVGWIGDEWGAPGLDPKRPFGNGDHLRDVHEILTGDEWSGEYGLPSGQTPERWAVLTHGYAILYRELETALQVVLAAGTFEPGPYEADFPHRNWRRSG